MDITNSLPFNPTIAKKVKSWLTEDVDKDTKEKLIELIQSHPDEVADAFTSELNFGTGGLRALMGIGPNRLNVYTIGKITQGLANYINKQNTQNKKGVVIGYDSRHHSKEFAHAAAKVLAANQINVYLFKEIRPTPLISFACRKLKTAAGIMITASHNPPEYNGYKIYDHHGGQVTSPNDKYIMDEIQNIHSFNEIKTSNLTNPLITWLDDKIDHAYLSSMEVISLLKEQNKSCGRNLKILYSNLHGTGITLVPQLLNLLGFTNNQLVEEQKNPDGSFPTVNSPNPEKREALNLGSKQLIENDLDIFLATDPDADRLAIVSNETGHPKYFTGNQIAVMLLEHILSSLKEKNRLPKEAFCAKSLSTTDMFQTICDSFSVPCFETAIGFKHIAALIDQFEINHKKDIFIFGAEDSLGYLYRSETRDKDGVMLAAILAELTLKLKLMGKTLNTYLHELYKKYGYFYDTTQTITFPATQQGKEKIKQVISAFRNSPPQEVNGIKVTSMDDFQENSSKINTNALQLHLEDQSKILIRPSGTEPLIKIYIYIRKGFVSDIAQAEEECHKQALSLLKNVIYTTTIIDNND